MASHLGSLVYKSLKLNKIMPNSLKLLEHYFSNSLIIHAALTQPEHLILVRWMGLETQWKTSWKHSRVWKPVFETISNTHATFLNLHIDKATKTRGDKQLYLRSGNTGNIFFNLSCNIVAVQVETLCYAYYLLRGQLVSQQKYDVASWGDMLRKVDSSSTFCNKF